jgi:hypothetical protein
VDNPALYRMRSGGALLPKNVNGIELLKDVHWLRADDIQIATQVPVGGGGGG